MEPIIRVVSQTFRLSHAHGICKLTSGVVGATLIIGLMLAALPGMASAQHGGGGAVMPAGALDPGDIPKYEDPLVIPPAIPRTSRIKPKGSDKQTDYYDIAVRQFGQHILPTSMGLAPTQVWGYGLVNHPGTFNYPAFTIEAKWQQPVRVKWRNELVKDPVDCFHTPGGPLDPASCDFLPHLLPVDETLHWANPPVVPPCKSGSPGTDCRTNCVPDGEGGYDCSYSGPVPMVVHVHGAETYEWSDGYPEAWYLPAAGNLGVDQYATGGSFFGTFNTEADSFFGDANDPNNAPDPTWEPGTATFQYPNEQEATTLWYHDHSLGMTRLNVYAGPAGFYLLRGGPGDDVIGKLPAPAPALGDPPGTDYYEIPIVVQDRSFNDDGSLFYPDNRAFFEDLAPEQLQIPFIPETTIDGEVSDVSPTWLPEFFGNTLVTNGKTWPALDVEKRRYRFRFLNGSQSRFLIMQFSTSEDGDHEHPATDVGVWQIGAEQGFLPAPVNIGAGSTNGVDGGILLGPAERADMILDFSDVPQGTVIYLRNFAPDEPFGGGQVGCPSEEDEEGGDFCPADPETTGQVMKLTVVKRKKNDKSTPADELMLPAPPVLGPADDTRIITLNELESETVCVIEDDDGNVVEVSCAGGTGEAFGPTEARLGTLSAEGDGEPLGWAEPTTEDVATGATEIWEIYNFTADAHPIHIHLVQFQVLDRQLLETDEDGEVEYPATLCAPEPDEDDDCVRAPEVWETGYKDTVISYPGEVTRVKAQYPLSGLFVWHCHILEHEDNEMMRPYCVGDPCAGACGQHNAAECAP